MSYVQIFNTFITICFKKAYSQLRYSNVIKTAYAAEAECGLEMDLGNYVAETLNSMELITHRAIAYILRKREKAAWGGIEVITYCRH